MGLPVTVALKGMGSPNGACEAVFLVDAGAANSMAPADRLAEAGIQSAGTMAPTGAARQAKGSA